jgi:hypothetical protein
LNFCTKADNVGVQKKKKSMNYISRYGVHKRIEGRWSYGVAFCGGVDNAKGCKGGECCCDRTKIIHKSVGGSTTRHKGASDGGSIAKGDGDGATSIESCSEVKTCNTGHNYTSRKMY